VKVAVVGCGYVGLVTGVGLASVGHDVVGIEVDSERRESIAAGRLPFHEPGLREALDRQRADGRFEVADDPRRAAAADVVLLAVQTPPRDDGSIELEFLDSAARQVAEALAVDAGRPRVVAVRSTVVPGTTDRVVRPIVNGRAAIASNPEFLREGTALSDFLQPDRVVVGTDDDDGWELLGELYRPLDAPVIRTSPTTAELTKYTSNALLATLISFSNEIARICEALPGVDVEEVLGIVHKDRRLSPVVAGQLVEPGILAFLKAGCGFGGSCLPKDLAALVAEQKAHGQAHPLLEAVLRVNDEQAAHVVELLANAIGELSGRSIAVLGIAFKGGTDDVRAAPGLRILDALLERGANAVVFDPLVQPSAVSGYVSRGVRTAASLDDAVEATDACVVTTNAPEFALLPDKLLARGDRTYVVVDGRRFLDRATFRDTYIGVGQGPRRREEIGVEATIGPR
jgi:UDPglucose 6-dehydrogenase/GDP-mannose 6-dehydrogenase